MDMSEIRQNNLRNNEKIKEAIKTILKEIGEDPDREGLQRTPFRWAKAAEEWFGGYNKDPKEVLNRTFSEKYDNMVIMRDISFFSFCEHHIIPFYGTVDIAYIPNKYITGLDKLIKLVEIYSRRLQIQERLTEEIANAIWKILKPKGVMVIVKAKHLCIGSRETRNQTTDTVTSAIRGVFANPPKGHNPREEFLNIIGRLK
jgi:GTP cyclohydrolase I